MQETLRPVDPEIVEQIKRTIHATMDQFGLRSVVVRPGEDHDGDAAIFVEAEYDLSETPLELGVTGKVATAVRELVRSAGETRFPYIRHKFHEEQKVKKAPRRARA
jgi:hypothetical protein